MLKTLKILTLSALVSVGGLTLAPMTASAQSGDGIYLRFGDRHGGEFGVRLGDDRRPHREWDRRGHGRGECSPGEAVNKAQRMGLRRARVVDVDRRSITVRGRAGGDREFVTFDRRSRNCRVIG